MGWDKDREIAQQLPSLAKQTLFGEKNSLIITNHIGVG